MTLGGVLKPSCQAYPCIVSEYILSSTSLKDGSRVFIVAHRTGHFIEAYEVTLYRVWADKSISLNWLGYEDGYWWWCNLRPGRPGVIEVRAFGGLMAEYEISTGNVKWLGAGVWFQVAGRELRLAARPAARFSSQSMDKPLSGDGEL
jgi:hypothetical protein